ncbi:nitrate reductase associated protein [Paraburkholderia hayleyella]|uniref:nitrate reductase associated protein n=1 Tax=Paraburkholderia hayleyella TaxID=2152889 RepID=UPI001291E579|nr:nitrate reductase associated protein [Paraburkholderia hayleyella]
MELHALPLLFNFEIASSQNLTFIPMAVRFNLDRCGLRISLAQWQTLPHAAREQLARYPLEDHAAATFAAALHALLEAHHSGAAERFAPEASPAWRNSEAVPASVTAQAILADAPAPDAAQWAALTLFQRYVLAKLSRKPHANHDFIPALREFGLTRD